MRRSWPLLSILALAVACGSSAPIGVEPARSEDAGAPAREAAAPPAAVGCSGDLQSVVAADGTVVMTCPPERGCWEGKCVAACEAAGRARGSFGCEFLVPTPVTYGVADQDPYPPQPCFTAVVVNAWSRPMRLTVSYGARYLDAAAFTRVPNDATNPSKWDLLDEGGLPPGKVAVLFLSADPTDPVSNSPSNHCPIPPALNRATEVNDPNRPLSGRGTAFRIETDVPATAYDLSPLGAISHTDIFGSRVPPKYAGGTLLLPKTSWGTAYTAVVPADTFSTIQVVASENDTKLTVSSKVDLPGAGSIPTVLADFPQTLTLAAGEYAQWFDASKGSGTIFASDKPVELVVGNSVTSSHQIMPPNFSLGSAYVLPPLEPSVDLAGASATKQSFLLMAIVDGTTLAYDPPIAGAPTTLAAGERVIVESDGAAYVKSQDAAHPFYAAQCATSMSTSKCGAFTNLLPPVQFLKRYVFYTDIGYQNTYLTLVRKKAGALAVDVDCMGGDRFTWHDVGVGAAYEYAHADIRLLDEPAYACQNGRHVASSDAPFGLLVRGFDRATYAYPAGGNVSIVNVLAKGGN